MKDTDQKCNVMQIEATAQYEAAQSKFSAMIEEGRSEMKNVDAFEAERRHNYEMRRAQVFEGLMKNQSNLIISGKSGDAILQ